MMSNNLEHPVYSPEVTSFVVVGREYCKWLEGLDTQPHLHFVATALKILPLLYFKAIMLPRLGTQYEDMLQVFVTENEYEVIKSKVQQIMGQNDDYLEVFTADMQYSDLPLTATISENLADIYQDVKDFLMNYRTSTIVVMNDALALLQDNFETYWGQRLVNVLRALHMLGFNQGPEIDGNQHEQNTIAPKQTSDWIITRRMDDFQGRTGRP